MTTTIAIFRKANIGKGLSAKAIEAEMELWRKRRMIRVERPQTLAFVLGAEFRKLPIVPASVLDSPCGPMDSFADGLGFEVPADELGRNGAITKQTADSIKSQIAKLCNLDPATFSVVVVEV